MGLVISFPTCQRQSVRVESMQACEPGKVIILPVIRVERMSEQAAEILDGARRAPGAKRRRRVRS